MNINLTLKSWKYLLLFFFFYRFNKITSNVMRRTFLSRHYQLRQIIVVFSSIVRVIDRRLLAFICDCQYPLTCKIRITDKCRDSAWKFKKLNPQYNTIGPSQRPEKGLWNRNWGGIYQIGVSRWVLNSLNSLAFN